MDYSKIGFEAVLEEETVAKGPTNVTNALFVGSTAELSKLLKQNKNQEETK